MGEHTGALAHLVVDLDAIKRFAASRWVKHLAGSGITIVCLIVFFQKIDVPEVIAAFVEFDWGYLILGMASLAVGYALRIARWSMMLKATGAEVDFQKCSGPFLGSIALNNVLPLRLGDVVRALVFPKSMCISRSTATSSLVVERLIDLMTLLASLAIGLFAIQVISIPEQLKVSAVSLAVVCSIVLALGFLFSGVLGQLFSDMATAKEPAALNFSTKAYSTLGSLLHSFDVMSRPRLLASMLAISMLVWAGEAGLYYFVLKGAGLDGSPLVALLVMAVATLSTLMPSSPGYVGPFHLAAFTAVSLVGGTDAQAGSYAVIVHLALWIPTTLVGALVIWAKPEMFRRAKNHTEIFPEGSGSNL